MYGKITVGYGTSKQRELQVIDFLQAKFKDNRVISISQIEDGTFVGSVENPPSTGRNTQATIWLSKESLIGLLSTAMLYFNIKGEDLHSLLEQAVTGDDVDYNFSENINADSKQTDR